MTHRSLNGSMKKRSAPAWEPGFATLRRTRHVGRAVPTPPFSLPDEMCRGAKGRRTPRRPQGGRPVKSLKYVKPLRGRTCLADTDRQPGFRVPSSQRVLPGLGYRRDSPVPQRKHILFPLGLIFVRTAENRPARRTVCAAGPVRARGAGGPPSGGAGTPGGVGAVGPSI